MVRKKQKKQYHLRCPVCGAPARLVESKDVFGKNALEPDRKMYICSRYKDGCDTYVFAQKGTSIPLGDMAGPEVRNLRIQAHRAINKVEELGIMGKDDIYSYLADRFGYPQGRFHLAQCSYYGCKETVRILNGILEAGKAGKGI
ncbi:MAG: DUF3268 family zinc-finger domain-containing protein [Clostridiales bacterium]|nr:DUF3268 family zinc-finger domain-containing protein [Clostridiales bacterium]